MHLQKLRILAHHIRPSSFTRALSSSLCEDTQAMLAKAKQSEGQPTLFDKILDKSVPSEMVYETEHVYCFRDIAPQAPTHVLCIPKVRDALTGLKMAEDRHEAILGKLMIAASKVAHMENLDEGYRIVVNDGPLGCQSVYHLHLHVLGGRQMTWPPG
jgi:diadenosine tetraphosphate (Ap4A) HIT family hydrolase